MFQSWKNYLKSVCAVLLLMTSVAATPATKSFVGTLSESMCGAKHTLPGKSDAECIQVCVKSNGKYALVADKRVYILSGPQEDFSKLAGKRVRVTGDNSGDTVTVKTIVDAN